MGKAGRNPADTAGKAPGKAPIWSWACCDNKNCQKWRRLPPGTAVDPNTPWFCYMNPDEDMNSCDVPEENYINDVEYAQEPEPLSVQSPGAPSKKAKPKGRGRGKQAVKGSKTGALSVKNGRIEKVQGQYQGGHKAEGVVRSQHSGRISRPPSSSGYLKEEQWSPPRGAAAYQQPSLPAGLKRKRGQSDSGDEDSSDDEGPPGQAGPSGKTTRPYQKRNSSSGPSARPAAAKIGPGKAKKLHKGFEKLLACGGVWEAAKGRGRAVTTAPHWIWEGLASYDPDAAELAVEAADMASSARYFSATGQLGSETTAQQDTELATRLTMAGAALLAAAQTSQASNIRGKPAPAKAPPRDKGGTNLPNPTTAAPDPSDATLASPLADSQQPGAPEGQPGLGVGLTDDDVLQQIMVSLRQPPSLPTPVPIHSAVVNPGVQGSQPTSLPSAAAAAAAQPRPAGPPYPTAAGGSRKPTVQPWQQPPQLTLPPGVSFHDPRNLYSRGLPGFPAMGKAAPYQGPPPSYQPLPQQSQRSMAPPAARSSHPQVGPAGSGLKPAGHPAQSASAQAPHSGPVAPPGHPTLQPQQQQHQQPPQQLPQQHQQPALLQSSAMPKQRPKQQQLLQQTAGLQPMVNSEHGLPQQQQREQQNWPNANGFHSWPPRQPPSQDHTQQQATANGPSQQFPPRSPADIASPGQRIQQQQQQKPGGGAPQQDGIPGTDRAKQIK